jgi:chemotaxis protein MotB
MARRKKREEHQNHEAWAIPYGDLVTLLLAFFVVMYAISQVNAGKYRVLSDSMVAAFRGSPGAAEPVQVGEQPGGARSDLSLPNAALQRPDPRHLVPNTPTDADVSHSTSVQPLPMPTLGAEAAPTPADALHRVADAVESAMQDLIASHAVVVRRHDLWVEVELRTDILFPSGAAVLAPAATPVIEKLGDALRAFPNPVRVEGYTDNRPINTTQFPSNWELSAARAATVLQVLARRGVDPARLSVLGLGEYRPVASNATPEGRNANRRVLLVIESTNEAPAPAATQLAGVEPAAPASSAAPATPAAPAPPATAAAPTAPESAVVRAAAPAAAPAASESAASPTVASPPPLPQIQAAAPSGAMAGAVPSLTPAVH